MSKLVERHIERDRDNPGGVISPGGVGYDINCGVRLLRTNLMHEDVMPRIEQLVDRLFNTVPCGVGRGGIFKFNKKELQKLMAAGSRYAINKGFGWDSDVEVTEAEGCIPGARPDFEISEIRQPRE